MARAPGRGFDSHRLHQIFPAACQQALGGCIYRDAFLAALIQCNLAEAALAERLPPAGEARIVYEFFEATKRTPALDGAERGFGDTVVFESGGEVPRHAPRGECRWP